MLLWLHGGAFVLPAAPDMQVRLVARLCRELDAVGFVPDYRLATFNRFPAALDDCERAYKAVLDLGFAPSSIAIGRAHVLTPVINASLVFRLLLANKIK